MNNSDLIKLGVPSKILNNDFLKATLSTAIIHHLIGNPKATTPLLNKMKILYKDKRMFNGLLQEGYNVLRRAGEDLAAEICVYLSTGVSERVSSDYYLDCVHEAIVRPTNKEIISLATHSLGHIGNADVEILEFITSCKHDGKFSNQYDINDVVKHLAELFRRLDADSSLLTTIRELSGFIKQTTVSISVTRQEISELTLDDVIANGSIAHVDGHVTHSEVV